ncbi:MAG TPA: DNA repair protein RadA [Patescibacteria group bacterium]
MPKNRSEYICQQCGYRSPSYLGKCPECGSWGSLVESVISSSSYSKTNLNLSNSGVIEPQSLTKVKSSVVERVSTGISELDRVLGITQADSKKLLTGIVPGSVIMLAGEPGIGKSTLLLQISVSMASKYNPKSDSPIGVLYVSAEESAEQVKLRAQRLGKIPEPLFILAETNVDAVVGVIQKYKPKLVIIDSIQTVATLDLESSPGSVGQVRESASRLHRVAKENHVSLIIVGHVTKEGSIAGPKTVEHLVDCVLSLEGEEFRQLRILRSLKNRFGSTFEVGVFEMTERGLEEVKNPSVLFLANRVVKAPGSVVVPTMQGSRPILTEIQALTTPTPFGMPKRVVTGVDYNRVQMLVAVLAKRAGVDLSNSDIFVNAAGGLKIVEPAADLAIAVSLASAAKGKPVDSKLIALGELGLLGELRPVGNLAPRIKEAKKLGFSKFLTFAKTKSIGDAVRLAIGA